MTKLAIYLGKRAASMSPTPLAPPPRVGAGPSLKPAGGTLAGKPFVPPRLDPLVAGATNAAVAPGAISPVATAFQPMLAKQGVGLWGGDAPGAAPFNISDPFGGRLGAPSTVTPSLKPADKPQAPPSEAPLPQAAPTRQLSSGQPAPPPPPSPTPQAPPTQGAGALPRTPPGPKPAAPPPAARPPAPPPTLGKPSAPAAGAGAGAPQAFLPMISQFLRASMQSNPAMFGQLVQRLGPLSALLPMMLSEDPEAMMRLMGGGGGQGGAAPPAGEAPPTQLPAGSETPPTQPADPAAEPATTDAAGQPVDPPPEDWQTRAADTARNVGQNVGRGLQSADVVNAGRLLPALARGGVSTLGKIGPGIPYALDAAQLLNEHVLRDDRQIPLVGQWAPGQFEDATTYKPGQGAMEGYVDPMLNASNHPIRSLASMGRMLNPNPTDPQSIMNVPWREAKRWWNNR